IGERTVGRAVRLSSLESGERFLSYRCVPVAASFETAAHRREPGGDLSVVDDAAVWVFGRAVVDGDPADDVSHGGVGLGGEVKQRPEEFFGGGHPEVAVVESAFAGELDESA